MDKIFLFQLGFLIFILGYSLGQLKQQQEEVFGAGPAFGTERYWQDIVHEVTGGEKEYRLDDGTRVDLLLREYACEIDWSNKWAEGIGQAIYYSKKTGKEPLVLLLVKKDGWEKYRDRVVFCGVRCWVFDTRTEEWINKE